MRLKPAFAFVAIALTPAPGFTEDMRVAPAFLSLSGPELQALLQSWGYRADLGTDRLGDPMITSGASGVDYAIHFYGCDGDTEPRRCASLTLTVGLDFVDGSDVATVNTWNAGSRFGRSYLDAENDPWLEWDILVEGGVTADNLRAHFVTWERSLASFLAATGW